MLEMKKMNECGFNFLHHFKEVIFYTGVISGILSLLILVFS